MQNISQKLDIVREKIEKMIKEIKTNKEINEYVKDYFSLYFYLISFFIIILIKYYIEIIIIERKNKIIGEKIIEYSQINNFYKKRRIKFTLNSIQLFVFLNPHLLLLDFLDFDLYLKHHLHEIFFFRLFVRYEVGHHFLDQYPQKHQNL